MSIDINHVFQLEEIQKCFKKAHFTGAPILCCTFTCHLFQSSRQPEVLNVQPGNNFRHTTQLPTPREREPRPEVGSTKAQGPGIFPFHASSPPHSMRELLSFLFLCGDMKLVYRVLLFIYLFIWLFQVWTVVYAIFIAACRNSLWPSGSLVMAHGLQSIVGSVAAVSRLSCSMASVTLVPQDWNHLPCITR